MATEKESGNEKKWNWMNLKMKGPLRQIAYFIFGYVNEGIVYGFWCRQQENRIEQINKWTNE